MTHTKATAQALLPPTDRGGGPADADAPEANADVGDVGAPRPRVRRRRRPVEHRRLHDPGHGRRAHGLADRLDRVFGLGRFVPDSVWNWYPPPPGMARGPRVIGCSRVRPPLKTVSSGDVKALLRLRLTSSGMALGSRRSPSGGSSSRRRWPWCWSRMPRPVRPHEPRASRCTFGEAVAVAKIDLVLTFEGHARARQRHARGRRAHLSPSIREALITARRWSSDGSRSCSSRSRSGPRRDSCS